MPRQTDTLHFKIFLFGAFHIENNKGTISLAARKAQALLAYLVLFPQEHAREKLAALFWGDSPDIQARDSLRTALKQLRKQFGDGLLLADRETIQLNPQFLLWVDVREFERLADSRWQTANREAISHLQSAISHYRGDLLADFFDDWILSERERLRELHLNTLVQLSNTALQQGDFTQAMEWAKRVLAHDATNEQAYRQLMQCHLALGNRSAALKQYEECARVLRAELDVEPSAETTALYLEIKRAAMLPPPNAPRRTNVPVPINSFIGRAREMERLQELIGTQRLVTLTGAGGSGKTRLAVQVAGTLLDQFHDGVWWVELAALNDPSLVAQTIAQELNVREVPNQPFVETLIHSIGAKQLLLVLDNCEHLIDACAQLAERLLRACANLKILATSREALDILGENIFQVPTLSLPTTLELPLHQVLEHEATRLFVERASAVNAEFALTAQNARAVAQICQRLDGIPLAVELAAARTKLLTPEHIAERLDDRFNLLTHGSRGALPRQQTLRATIDWSYDLLPDDAKKLFRRLSVFVGGFTLVAAETICADEQVDSAALLEELARLVDRSLVIVEQQNARERYRMLETIREYAREKLHEAGEVSAIRNQHLGYFANIITETEPELERLEMGRWLDRLETEVDNLRAAIDWASESSETTTALRLVSALGRFWFLRNHDYEGHVRIRKLLESPDARAATSARLKILNTYFFMLWPHGKIAQAQSWIDEALTLAFQLGNDSNTAYTLVWAGLSAAEQGNYELAQEYLETSQDKWHDADIAAAGDVSLSFTFLGEIASYQGNYARAKTWYERAAPRLRERKDYPYLAMVIRRLGQVAIYQSEFAQAHKLIQESLELNLKVNDYRGIGGCLTALATLKVAENQIVDAVKLLALTNHLLESMLLPLLPFDEKEYERAQKDAQAQLEKASFEGAWHEGMTMSLEQGIDDALKINSDSRNFHA